MTLNFPREEPNAPPMPTPTPQRDLATPAGPKSPLWVAAHAPDYLDQLAHVDVVRDQELGLVQDWQLLLTLVALYDHLGTGGRGRVSSGRGLGRGLGRAGTVGLTGILLGCWSRICCTSLQRSAAEGGRALRLDLGPRAVCPDGPRGAARPTSPKPPPPGPSGRPGHRTGWGGPRSDLPPSLGSGWKLTSQG